MKENENGISYENQNEFDLPTNIRQIGGISDGLKIYMEDYVFTYLRQIAESGGNNERLAVLVGKHIIVDSQPTMFINGALQAVYTENADGIERFTAKTFAHAEEQIEMYFKGYEIVGWMLSQPGYGVRINAGYADYHISNFNKTYHALFVIDPIDKLNAFYIWDKNHEKIEECKGYFIYYKQNEGMQEYMLNNKIAGAKQTVPFRRVEGDGIIRKVSKTGVSTKNEAEENDDIIKASTASSAGKPKREVPEVLQQMRKKYLPENFNPGQKRVTNMLVSLSAVLFVICFIMGAALIQSDGRINRLEQEVTSLGQANEFMATQIRQIAAMEVFAGGPPMQQQTPPPTPQQTLPPANQTPSPVPTAPPGVGETPPVNTAPPDAGSMLPTPTPTPAPGVGNATETPTPTPTEPPSVGANYRWHTVQEHETLFGINRLFFGDTNRINEILELNGITDPDRITAGVQIRIPF